MMMGESKKEPLSTTGWLLSWGICLLCGNAFTSRGYSDHIVMLLAAVLLYLFGDQFAHLILRPAMPSTTQGTRQAYEPGLSHRNIGGGTAQSICMGTENSCSMDLYLVLSWLLTAQLTDCACLLFIPLQHDVMGSQWYSLSEWVQGDAAKGITNKCM